MTLNTSYFNIEKEERKYHREMKSLQLFVLKDYGRKEFSANLI